MALSPGNSGPEAGSASKLNADSSRANEKIVRVLSLKIFQNDTIDIEDLVGFLNRQAGCLPVAVSGSRRGRRQALSRATHPPPAADPKPTV